MFVDFSCLRLAVDGLNGGPRDVLRHPADIGEGPDAVFPFLG
eukprot:CAMPEP_0115630504 /NCGR_PEP_ID=MMETSP0272-20121206/30508_1 /TAXON_ID=71861 /ORGANISM="Scrippsiella trochoidea, Strain CCMP3099" /LENGTH=41 /DNA_ID= /DNA_START= /DNA_END= /DNA_ORIENTATION=